jgi:broad specificity phosphatase PhoE
LAARLVFVANAPIDETRSAAFPLPTSQITSKLEPVALRSVARLRGPELRCAQTADGLGWSATVEPELADLDLGSWAGADPMAVMAADPASIDNFFSFTTVRPPNGETVSELIARVGRLCDREWPDGRTLLVTSPMVVRAAAVHLLALPSSAFFSLDVEPLSALSCSAFGSRWKLRGLMPFAAWSMLWNRGDTP